MFLVQFYTQQKLLTVCMGKNLFRVLWVCSVWFMDGGWRNGKIWSVIQVFGVFFGEDCGNSSLLRRLIRAGSIRGVVGGEKP